MLTFCLTFLPLVGFMGGTRYWPGFFYAPFYTTNILNDSTTPSSRAGLRPEDRVVGLNRQLVENLYAITEQKGANGEPILLIWEVGPGKAGILPVVVEKLDWLRALEKYTPFLILGAFLLWWGGTRSWLAVGGALFYFAAADYWLNPGAGRLSGLDPAAWWTKGRFWLASAKWSTFIYAPLVIFLWTTITLELLKQLLPGRRRRYFQAWCGVILLAELAAYSYDAAKTAIYNNPNYLILHARVLFFLWLVPLLLVGWLVFRQRIWRSWLALLGLLIFVLGYLAQTTFDRDIVQFIGAHWFSAGLVIFIVALEQPAFGFFRFRKNRAAPVS